MGHPRRRRSRLAGADALDGQDVRRTCYLLGRNSSCSQLLPLTTDPAVVVELRATSTVLIMKLPGSFDHLHAARLRRFRRLASLSAMIAALLAFASLFGIAAAIDSATGVDDTRFAVVMSIYFFFGSLAATMFSATLRRQAAHELRNHQLNR